MQRLIPLLFLWITNALSLAAADVDTVAILERRSLWHETSSEQRLNPAFMLRAFAQSYSELGAAFDYRHENKPFAYQNGSGHSMLQLYADSHLHLSPHTTVWGNAAYGTGEKHGIRYNSTSDYDLLYPYVLGDTLGGGLTHESYRFAGGVATMCKKATMGAEIDFRATHEYRTTDPRPRSIVTDLTVKFGATYPVGAYQLGGTVGSVFYKQTNDVAFYREAGVIPEYLYTGLGADYTRFSGSNASCYYKATGVLLAVAAKPKDENGAFLSADYRFVPYQQILPKLNALPLATLYLTTWQVVAGWKQQGDTDWSVYAAAKHESRMGDEHIAGNPSGSEYRTLLDLTMYKHRIGDYSIRGLVRFGKKQTITVQADAGYRTNNAEYVFPQRRMQANACYGKLTGQWQRTLSRTATLSATLGAVYRKNIHKHIVMPYATMDKHNTELVNHTYRALTKDDIELNTDVLLAIKPARWNTNGCFARVHGTWLRGKGFTRTALSASIGVYF